MFTLYLLLPLMVLYESLCIIIEEFVQRFQTHIKIEDEKYKIILKKNHVKNSKNFALIFIVKKTELQFFGIS